VSNSPRSLLVVSASLLLLGSVLAAPAPAGTNAQRIEPVWHVAAPPEARSVIADDRGSVITGLRGELWATEAIGGSQWRVTVAQGEEITPDPPAMDDALVVVPVDARRVVALDRTTGALRWQQPAEGVLAVGVGSTPTVRSVAVVTPERVLVLSGDDGSLRWETPQPVRQNHLTAAPRAWFAAGRLIVAWADSVNYVRGYDLESGALSWSLEVPEWATSPAVFDDELYLVANLRKERGHFVSELRSVDVVTGSQRWARRVRGVFLPTFRPAVDEHTIAAVDIRGTVLAFDRGTGDLRWREQTRHKQYENQASIAGPVVAMTTYGTGLVALRATDGYPIENQTPGPAQTSAVIVDSATAGDQLYLLVHLGSVDNGQLWMLAPT